MLSQGANYTADFMVRETDHRLEKEKKNTCPLLDASLMMLWHDMAMAYVEIYTALQKFGNALENWGFGQYWHESFIICDNFPLIRDNTNYENIFYYINSLNIEISTISSYYSSA